jgi:hypothetical protein
MTGKRERYPDVALPLQCAPTYHYRFLYHEVDAADCYPGWEQHASFSRRLRT